MGKKELLRNFIEIDISQLVKADWNYKLDDPVKKEKLKANIKRNGQIENIIIRELDTGFFEVVNGNHRLDAFVELGFTRVVAYNCGRISLPQAQRIAIETNETRFESDQIKLAGLIEEIKIEFSDEDLITTLPWTEAELLDILNVGHSTIDDISEIEDDNFTGKVPDNPKTQPGDLYELNGHRLLCGDSTNPDDVAKLMNGQLAHMLFTDPPYNINYPEFNKNRSESGKDWTDSYCSEWRDSMSDSDYISFLKSFIQNAKNNLIEWGHYYIWHASTYYRELITVLEELDIPYDKVPIQWVKQVAPLSWVRYKRITEPCIFGGRGAVNGNGEGARWFGPNNETNAWIINREHNGNYIHPTQKPVSLASRAIRNSSQKGEIVLDMFLGSGTTLIASDILERFCYGLELEPRYCDAIILRYIQYCQDNDKPLSIIRNNEEFDKSFFE